MKLLSKTNTQYITFSIIAYLLIAMTFYIVTEYVIYQEVEYRLQVEGQDFRNFVKEQGFWESSCYFVENKIALTAVTDTLKPIEQFTDTLFANRYTGQIDPFRQYSFYTVINDQAYKVDIRKSLIESITLLKFITATMLILLSVGLLVLFFLQRKVSKRLWQPFYQSLQRAKSFDVSKGVGLDMSDATIHEFNELNQVLNKMTRKIAVDYQNLKEFTENAAHEIQTPLALISSRIEELIQGSNFNDKQMYWLDEIHRSTIRLSKLHQGLLLLSKIDNGQFYEHQRLNLTTLIKNKIEEQEEILTHKQLKVNVEIQENLFIEMNPTLADILLSNLINNAIKHNVTAGSVEIKSTESLLQISNTGAEVDFDPNKLFERFKKQKQNSDSLGLGLAIVHKICDYYSIDISYQVDLGIHTFQLRQKYPTI